MQIREPTSADTESITEELLIPSYRASETLDPTFNELDEAAIDDAGCGYWLDHDDRTMFVAETDGIPIGMISAIVADSPPIYARGPRAHIDGLYVKCEYRRQGVATQLIERVENWAERKGCEYLGVTAHSANEAATDLYDHEFGLTLLSYRRMVSGGRQ